jgi:hypothetical protein
MSGMSYELGIEMDTINLVIEIIDMMRDEGNYHNPTLDELEDRLQ